VHVAGGGQRGRQVTAGHDDGELLAAVAGDEVTASGRAPQRRGDEPQELVAGCVAVQVVVALEVVDIDHGEAERPALLRGQLPFLVQGLLEAPPVGQPGQRVGGRQLLQAPVGLGQLCGPLGHAAFQGGVELGIVEGDRQLSADQ